MLTCSSRCSTARVSAGSARGMTAPKTNAPKMAWMPMASVAHADSSSPASTTASTSGVSRPAAR